jgi:Family of unknown function (DUF5677)
MSNEDLDAKRLVELLALPYSVENQSAIAKYLNNGDIETHDRSPEENFENVMMFLSIVSSKVVGLSMSLGHSLGTAIIGKICVTAMSIQDLFRGHEAGRLPFLDHASIAVLSRAIIDSSIMYFYLTEDVSGEEWAFRFKVMQIHDVTSRLRLFKGINPEEAEKQRTILNGIRNELKEMAFFKQRQEEEREKLLGGQMLYVSGMRSTLALMNFDKRYFDGVYNYLSAYVHSMPLSYFRDSEGFEQSFWQRVFAGYALHHAWVMMIRVALREVELSGLEGQFDAELLRAFHAMAAHMPTVAMVP